jgi:spore coat polysaccharide biosynthesis protein SpsF
MKKKITAIVQARMASTRLPGKIMKEVLGRPLLSYLIERLRCCRYIDHIILATTTSTSDDPVVIWAENSQLSIFRGSEHNVLDRFYQAASFFCADHIMRITADCPLIDPDLLDDLIVYYRENTFDYVSNCAHVTLPDGLDAEIFTFQALEYAHRHAIRPSCLEHVTPFIRNHPLIFTLGSWTYSRNLSHLRWTVDEIEDLLFVQQVIEHLYPVNKHFRFNDILSLLNRKPQLVNINSHIVRNQGFLSSLRADKEFLINKRNLSH